MSLAASIWPIWKRAEVNIKDYITTYETSFQFRVRACNSEADATDPTKGTIIYEGVASAAPNSNAVIVSINDIAADYLGDDMGGWFALDAWNEPDGNSWDSIGYWFFVRDYSFDYDFNAATMPFPHPVTGIFAPNQWAVFSGIDFTGEDEATVTIELKDGTEVILNPPLLSGWPFGDAFADDFDDAGEYHGMAGFFAVNLSALTNPISIEAYCGGISTPVYAIREDTCKRYALYYRNAYGGYDSLLMDGAKRAENYARSTIGRWANNSVKGFREIHDYRNEIEEVWTLRINSLTDEQAERMPQVTGSVDAYLCDLSTGDLVPLNLQDAACEIKTYRNQGGKRINYTITVKRAQKRERR